MKLINWNEEVEADLSDDHNEEILMTLLRGNINDRWEGRIKKRKLTTVDFMPPYVELRKNIGSANVLFRVGARSYISRGCGNGLGLGATVSPYIVAEMSMNAKALFEPNDFTELQLVVIEAEGVVKWLQAQEETS